MPPAASISAATASTCSAGAGDDHDRRTGRRVAEGDGPADAAPAAGDERDLAREVDPGDPAGRHQAIGVMRGLNAGLVTPSGITSSPAATSATSGPTSAAIGASTSRSNP